MSRQFNRKAVVTVGPKGGMGRKIDGLRVIFKIEKSATPTPNNAHIQIFNLAETTRALFTEKKSQITLEVGYDGSTELIFKGDIRQVTHKKQGPDIVTEVEAGDGEAAIKVAKINKSFPAGASVEQIFRDVAGTFEGIKNTGKPLLASGVVAVGKQFLNGFVASGSSKSIMDDLMKKVDAEWSIQDEELQITRKDTPTIEVAVALSSETGLVESPGKITAETSSGKKDGVNFKALLNPSLRPGRAVLIKSQGVNGAFRVSKVVHAGDSMSGKWLSECEATTHGI